MSIIINESDDFNDFQYKYSKFVNINRKNLNSIPKYFRDVLKIDNNSINIKNGNKVIIKKNGRKGVLINNENNKTMGKVSVKLNNETIEKFRMKNLKKNLNV